MSKRNFASNRDGTPITVVTGINTTVPLGDDAFSAAAQDVMYDNRGGSDCYVKTGGADVAATTASPRIPANSIGVYDKSAGATHLSVYGAGPTTLVFFVGDGD